MYIISSFQNEDIIMIIIVPRAIDGIKKIERNLKTIKLNYEDMKNNERYIDLFLPKFKAETTVTLDKPLCKVKFHNFIFLIITMTS